ncbi:hypothetical protein ACFLRT_03730 [Acidobacteriota bacterium]
MINREELLICLDEIDFDRFISLFGARISTEYLKIIEFLISGRKDQVQFSRVYALARFIFIERQGQHFGEPTHFEVDKNMESFQEFIYLLRIFVVLKVPFDVWKELVVVAFDILNEQIENGNIKCKGNPKYPEFTKKYNKILDEIIKDPEREQKYADFLNGAL